MQLKLRMHLVSWAATSHIARTPECRHGDLVKGASGGAFLEDRYADIPGSNPAAGKSSLRESVAAARLPRTYGERECENDLLNRSTTNDGAGITVQRQCHERRNQKQNPNMQECEACSDKSPVSLHLGASQTRLRFGYWSLRPRSKGNRARDIWGDFENCRRILCPSQDSRPLSLPIP